MADFTIRELSREEYGTFLGTVPHSAFHRLAWLDVITQVYRLRVRLLGYMRGSQLCAVTPLMGRRIGPLMLWGAPLRKCGTPPATPFCSPAGEAERLLASFRDWIYSQSLTYVQITTLGNHAAAAAAADLLETMDNLELDLSTPLEAIWRNISQQKSAVRKAIREGVKVHFRWSVRFIETQRTLLASTYGRQGVISNFPVELYEALLSDRQKTGLHILSAEYQGQTVAAMWVFNDLSKCYYWDAASLDEARRVNANHLLVWCLIRWAHRKNLRTLDFVGTSIGGRGGSRPGIGQFKQSMGGRPVQYSILYWFSPFTRAAFFGYRWLNRLRLGLRGGNRHASNP